MTMTWLRGAVRASARHSLQGRTRRQQAIVDLAGVRPEVERRARDPESSRYWRLHRQRNDRKHRWFRFLEEQQSRQSRQST